MLLYPPPTKSGLEEWAFHHIQAHRAINEGMARLKEAAVDEFNIYPLDLGAFDDFLAQNQKWHDATNLVLNVPGVDLRNVDFQNPAQRDAWLWLHFLQHRTYAERLGEGY